MGSLCVLKEVADAIRKDMADAHNQYILEIDKNKIINGVLGITSSVNPSINKCNTNREELTKLFLLRFTCTENCLRCIIL